MLEIKPYMEMLELYKVTDFQRIMLTCCKLKRKTPNIISHFAQRHDHTTTYNKNPREKSRPMNGDAVGNQLAHGGIAALWLQGVIFNKFITRSPGKTTI